MQSLPQFELKRATSLAQAVAWLAADPRARLHAGGTDLLPNLRRGIEHAPVLVDLSAVHGLSDITHSDTGMALGARVTLARLATDASIAQQFPVLAQAARAVAGPAHRSAATLGGNLCLDTRCVFYNQSEWWRRANQHCLKRPPGGAHAAAPRGGLGSPAEPDLPRLDGTVCHVAPQGRHCHAAFSGDLAPALLVLGAEVDLASERGTRRVPLAGLYRDDGAAHLTLAHDEVLIEVHLPAAPPGQRCGYRKARTRAAMDFPLAGVACALTLQGGRLGVGDASDAGEVSDVNGVSDASGVIADLRVAITGTNSNPFLLAGCDEFAGRRVDAELLAQLGKRVQKQVSPMRSSVTPSNYRRLAAAALAQRLVLELAGAAKRAGGGA
jgi:4-hydroxybenzoyl-CoA reductase subunit beta